VTQIDHRFINLIFVSQLAVQALLDLGGPIESGDNFAPIMRWFQDGEILSATDGLMGELQRKAKRGDWIKSINADTRYRAWFQINYNLAQLNRMIQSD